MYVLLSVIHISKKLQNYALLSKYPKTLAEPYPTLEDTSRFHQIYLVFYPTN